MGENVVVLGERMVGAGGGGWVCCAVLCCAAAVYTPKASPKLTGRTEETEPARRAAANLFPRVCAPQVLIQSLRSLCFLLLLLLFFYNQDHQLKSSSLPPDSRVDTLALATPMDRSRANCHF